MQNKLAISLYVIEDVKEPESMQWRIKHKQVRQPGNFLFSFMVFRWR